MNEDVKPLDPVSPEPAPVAAQPEPVAPKPGEKTDPALLLKSLQEERAKRKELEAALAAKENVPEKTGVAFSEEGRALEEQIKTLEAKIAAGETMSRLSAVRSAFPVLKDKQAEFDNFLAAPENAGMSIETAAKAFLVENDLLEVPSARKGLEKDTGGGHTPIKEGMTPEEIDDLRVNNYREYVRRIKSGTLG